MAFLRGTIADSQTTVAGGRSALGRIFALLLMVALSAAIVLGWDRIEGLGVYGYPAVFLVSLLSSATVVLPAPGFALVAAAGSTLNPISVAVVAGLGASLGELTAYVAGTSGQGVVKDQPLYRRLEAWMRRSGALVLFVLAAVPNPIFDVGGLIAGALSLPVWHFILATWLGKSLRFAFVAGFGAVAL